MCHVLRTRWPIDRQALGPAPSHQCIYLHGNPLDKETFGLELSKGFQGALFPLFESIVEFDPICDDLLEMPPLFTVKPRDAEYRLLVASRTIVLGHGCL